MGDVIGKFKFRHEAMRLMPVTQSTLGDCISDIHCKRCEKPPAEIPEYQDFREFGCESPDDMVQREEGTYNPTTGLFYCTQCYIALGCPSGKA